MAEKDQKGNGGVSGGVGSKREFQETMKRALIKKIRDSEEPLKEIMTEQEVLDLLGFKKDFLDRLRREEGLPFCKLTTQKRVYLARDVAEWTAERRTVLNVLS